MHSIELLYLELKKRLSSATSHMGMEEKIHYVVFREWVRPRKLKFMLANEITLRIYGFVDIIIGPFFQTFKK
jgi:hypothetical protein